VTVAVGALAVFFPMRLLLSAIVLQFPSDRNEELATGRLGRSVLLLSSVGVVFLAFFRHVPFLVIDIAELLIAYGILGGLLQAGRWRKDPI
jgi:hypothetical protein